MHNEMALEISHAIGFAKIARRQIVTPGLASINLIESGKGMS